MQYFQSQQTYSCSFQVWQGKFVVSQNDCWKCWNQNYSFPPKSLKLTSSSSLILDCIHISWKGSCCLLLSFRRLAIKQNIAINKVTWKCLGWIYFFEKVKLIEWEAKFSSSIWIQGFIEPRKFQNKRTCFNPIVVFSYFNLTDVKINKNYQVVRNVGPARSRNTWKLTVISFYEWINQIINQPIN